jgi:hypothetical protein
VEKAKEAAASNIDERKLAFYRTKYKATSPPANEPPAKQSPPC